MSDTLRVLERHVVAHTWVVPVAVGAHPGKTAREACSCICGWQSNPAISGNPYGQHREHVAAVLDDSP